MNQELSDFAARLRGLMAHGQSATGDGQFSGLALELFALQFKHNAAYRKICAARNLAPGTLEHWTQIPAAPTAAFKELELSCLPPAERAAVFHSSGTTEQRPSRHFHSAESLKLYETSLMPWFLGNVLPDLRLTIDDLRADENSALRTPYSAIFLTPPPDQVPHSSLVHMFETVRRKLSASAGSGLGVPPSGGRVNAELQTEETAEPAAFFGQIAADGSWTLDFAAVINALSSSVLHARSSRGNEAQISAGDQEVRASSRRLLHFRGKTKPILLLGTAFSFVHLLDHLAETHLSFQLPPGSRVMETGGYKNRSRSLPKAELHALITERLGVPPENIICEYGMSELSSQAYDNVSSVECRVSGKGSSSRHPSPVTRRFHFPPWSRVQIISPETGREVAEGETGLIRIFDLANVFSVLAVQTEDLGIRRGNGFELIGRAALAEPRGCSLMSSSARK